jgi:hypothetical protein
LHLFAPQKGEWGASFSCIDRAIPGFSAVKLKKSETQNAGDEHQAETADGGSCQPFP